MRCNRLGLSALLVAPMQHWTRLPLMLKRVHEYTDGIEDRAQLYQSMERVVSSLSKYSLMV